MKKSISKLVKWCIFLIFTTISGSLFSQKTITGTIMDGGSNDVLIGGSVMIKNKTVGTVTDVNGKYSIRALASDILVFSYIGMETQEVSVGDKTTINLSLKPISHQLTEVVAIGYGTVKKSDLTGSVAVVSTKDLTKNPSSSAAQALQGKATGVLVSESGQPGGGATIRVRGVGSINKGADPIFIVDGVQAGDINGIQPQDIENMQVLKDASATAIYGANGSNGVIIINTKRGKSGKTQVNLNTYVGTTLAPVKYNVMNAQQYADFLSSTTYKANGLGKTYSANGATVTNPAYALSSEFRQKYYGSGWETGTDWQSLMFKNGFNQNYNLSLAGGSDNSNFNVSLNYIKENGNVIASNAERYGIRANSDFKLSKHIKIGENLNVSYSTTQNPVTYQSTIWNLNLSPLMKVYNSYYKGGFESCQTGYWEDANGNLQQVGTNGYTNQPSYFNTVGNDKPSVLAAPSIGSNMAYGMSSNASVYMQIDFTDWLMFKIMPSVGLGSNRTKIWLPSFTGNRGPSAASLTEAYSQSVTYNLENQIVFKKKFNDVHNVQATAVYSMRAGTGNGSTAAVNGFNFENLNTLTNGGTVSSKITGYSSESRMLSYLGRVMYDYAGKYYMTASFRSDGNYVFAPAYRRGNFASGSFAWKVNEDFLKNVKDIDVLKLRLGWGQTGNSNIGAGFQYVDGITDQSQFSPVFGDDQHIAQAQYVFYNFASKEIHWESSEMWNIGVDLNMFNGKLQSSVEYYIKNNNDLLVAIPISSAFGRMNGTPWFNTGKIQNQGIELSFQWKDNIGDFNYGINSNFTTIKNEVKYLPVPNITTGNNRTIVGHSIGALYGYAADGIIQTSDFTGGKDPITGLYTGYKYATQMGNIPQPGDIKYKDLNGDGNVDALDKTIIGKTIPSFTYTLGLDCSYKDFDFNIFFFGVSDFNIFNAQRASLSSMNSQDMDHNKLVDWAQNFWTEQNASTKYVRYDASNKNVNDQISSFWIEDGSFLRVKDVQIGYTLPKKKCTKLGLASLRIYGNASNLYCFTGYKGRDPEGLMSTNPLNSGTDNGDYTVPRSFTLGLQIGF